MTRTCGQPIRMIATQALLLMTISLGRATPDPFAEHDLMERVGRLSCYALIVDAAASAVRRLGRRTPKLCCCEIKLKIRSVYISS